MATGDLIHGRLLLWTTSFATASAIGLPASRPLVGQRWAVLLGPVLGAALFCVLAESSGPGRPRPGAAALRIACLGGGAAFEELVWRGVALGALVPVAGQCAALAATTAAFALAHRGLGARRWVHLATGGTFGVVFLCAGLAAAILAHALYNLLVDVAVKAERRGAEAR